MPQSYDGLGRILVIIPTYNEIDNVDMITGRLRAAVPEAHILVVDDNSPDGTGRRADELAAADDHIHVLHRQGKEGLGAAYKAGFAWGLGGLLIPIAGVVADRVGLEPTMIGLGLVPLLGAALAWPLPRRVAPPE